MRGLSAYELKFRSQGIVLSYFHNEALEGREGKLAFGVPYETLLGMICRGDSNLDRAAAFFIRLSQEQFQPVADYLAGFIRCLTTELDFSSCDLAAKAEYRNTPMDFPRPSPARVLVWQFAGLLARDEALRNALAASNGADLVFR
jgi:hypothetical protein